jgi:hypothetical protein
MEMMADYDYTTYTEREVLSMLSEMIDQLGSDNAFRRVNAVLMRYPQPTGGKLKKAITMAYFRLLDEKSQ